MGDHSDPIAYGEVDLNLLLVLERVLQRQSVSAAAADLGLSPSATSRALQRLRDTLGDPLLVRAGNQLVPTERAQALVGPARRAVEAARDVFLGATFDPASATGAFVLGLGDELQHALFPAIFAHVRRRAPGIDLRVRNLTMRSAEEGRRDLVHLGIAPDLTTLPSAQGLPDVTDLVHRPLYERRFVVVGAASAWPEAPDLDAYVAAHHAIMSDEAGGRGFVDDLLDGLGHTRRVAATLTSFPAIAALLRATDLLALMPAEVVPTLGQGLVAHDPPLALPSMRVHLVWHPRHTTRPRHRALRGWVQEAVLRTTRPSSTASAPTTATSPPK
ncbi:MAG: LysR family transcriptional regulator [Myxococcales bacterium]|nr:LysR family transcriptional regulator [Myxococcales bacterium]